MSWIYNKKKITCLEDLPDYDKLEGFVYKITNNTTKAIYIGKKSFLHNKKTRITKKEKLATQTRKVFKRVSKDSGWMDYFGSSLLLKDDVKLLGKDNFTREILELAYTKKYLTYCEIKYQILLDVLSLPSYNANIAGKIFRKDVINKKD